MSVKREHFDVRVSENVLHVGQQRLPLSKGARATTTELQPDREAVVRRYATTVAPGLLIATAVSAVTSELVSALVSATALAWFTVRTVNLFRSINKKRYRLTVETATGSHQVLVSDNPDTVAAVGFTVMDAINDAAVTRPDRQATNKRRHDDPPNRVDMA